MTLFGRKLSEPPTAYFALVRVAMPQCILPIFNWMEYSQARTQDVEAGFRNTFFNWAALLKTPFSFLCMKGHSIPIMWQLIAFFSRGLLNTIAIVCGGWAQADEPDKHGVRYIYIYISNAHFENILERCLAPDSIGRSNWDLNPGNLRALPNQYSYGHINIYLELAGLAYFWVHFLV